MHLVCACEALNVYMFLSHGVSNICILYVCKQGIEWVRISRVMVSQAYAFVMCKSAVLNGYTFPQVWCLIHTHSVYTSVSFNGCIYSEVWSLKHMHSVRASAAFKSCISVSQTCAFSMCKCCQSKSETGPKVEISRNSPACVGSMHVQVWPPTSIYFSSYDDLNPLHSCKCGELACAKCGLGGAL
jgi:hypothetical protein